MSVALLGDSIYAMGGFDGHVRQNSVERYNPDTNQWSLVQPMNHQRSDASATTLDGQFRFRSMLLYVHTDRKDYWEQGVAAISTLTHLLSSALCYR